MRRFDRREFLKLGTAGVALGVSAPLLRNPMFRQALLAGDCDVNPAKKLLVIFLRGGNDGVNTVIPHGDATYNTSTRPTLHLPYDPALDLNGYASLHPALEPLMELHLAGKLAVIHRVGYTGQSRSHFSSQQFWENAEPGNDELEEGWVQRVITSDPSLTESSFPAAAVGDQFPLMFRGPRALPHIQDISAYSVGDDPADLKLLGALPGGGTDGAGLLGVYSEARPDVDFFEPSVRGAGLALASSLDHLTCRGVDPDAYVPHGGATYPTSGDPEGFVGALSFDFFRQVRQAAQLLKETDVRVVGVELDGFDNHANQGTVTGRHARRLEIIAHAIRSLWLDLQGPVDTWSDTLIMTLSEFGRTSEENSSGGTDHGEASVMMVAGGPVQGGVWNCDPATWAQGDLLSTPNGRYVAHATDFRTVLAQIAEQHFGLSTSLDTIIPGWSGLTGPTFAPVSFI